MQIHNCNFVGGAIIAFLLQRGIQKRAYPLRFHNKHFGIMSFSARVTTSLSASSISDEISYAIIISLPFSVEYDTRLVFLTYCMRALLPFLRPTPLRNWRGNEKKKKNYILINSISIFYYEKPEFLSNRYFYTRLTRDRTVAVLYKSLFNLTSLLSLINNDSTIISKIIIHSP